MSKELSYYNIEGYNITRKPTLSYEETMELLRKYKSGDQEAGKKIIEHNYGLVIKECFSYSNSRVSKLELFQEGCIGLMAAMDRFDIDSKYIFQFMQNGG